jgi:hypothetical protein
MRRWIVAAVVLALAVGAAVAYTYAAPKRYDAVSRVVVHPVPAGDNTFAGIDVLRDSQHEAPIMATAAAYFTTPEVLAAAADALGSGPEALRDHLDVRPLTGSSVLQVIGKDEDGRRAAEIANAVRQAGIGQRTARFQAQLAAVLDKVGKLGSVEARRRLVDLRALQGRPDPTLETLTVATAPADAAWPDADVVIPAGLGIGLGLAALIVLLPPLLRPGRRRAGEERDEALAVREQELAARELELADREQALERRANAMTQREGELAAAVDEARAATADKARLDRRVAELTTREQAMARRAAELERRETALHERERGLADRVSSLDDRERRLRGRDLGLDGRAHELNTRAGRLAERERDLEAREASQPPPESAGAHPSAGWTIQDLERAVAQHGGADHERIEEWRYYLHFLRAQADVDGRLPERFDGLIEETFADVLDDVPAEA